jgi:hypothetical protein
MIRARSAVAGQPSSLEYRRQQRMILEFAPSSSARDMQHGRRACSLSC